ncbi:5-methylaminomethyl-2-thiouridylate-methyltransferase [Cristinia sonorae]|uniref:tRNA-5-taurinomethyluridine 2-sulfurtransferase n=1 Tax=Cristinia sonorae TaxID=1940300 RepID=A0A8K0UXF1_9AGAR|nr:5-methylaminomethyl-2-thiouridylate-methyltransferase [Cristinia sonorae]
MFPWRAALRRISCRSYYNDALFSSPQKGSKVVAAMSGGVDSSVVAGLLSKQDYDLSAVFMRNWDTRDESGTDKGCEWEKDWEDVQKVCQIMDIPCIMIDLSREYWTRVFEPSLHAWERGHTPNPDIWCNKEVKFGALMSHLSSPNTWIATGHYARKGWSSLNAEMIPRPQLLRPADRLKDQTFYLSAMPESSLRRTLFPIADLQKHQVRELAHQWQLPVANREESMGICFVGEKRKFTDFLSQYIPPKAGHIINGETGEVVGDHDGLWRFTIGQGARLRGHAQKLFVSAKDFDHNVIYVVPGSDHPDLYKKQITVRDWQWIWADSPPPSINESHGFQCRMQYAHRMMDVPCTVRRGDASGAIVIELEEAQRAVAPGQVAVVWDGDWCLGCGVIERTE